MVTKLWRIKEHPDYTVERTPGAWVLWGPCPCLAGAGGRCQPCRSDDQPHLDDCHHCGMSGEVVVDSCGMDEKGEPLDQDMVARHVGHRPWTPERIQ